MCDAVMTHIEEKFQTDSSVKKKEENELFQNIYQCENKDMVSQRDRCFSDEEQKSSISISSLNKQIAMDVLGANVFQYNKEMSLNSSAIDGDSLQSSILDTTNSEENCSGKRSVGRQHRIQSERNSDDYSYGERKVRERSESRKHRHRNRFAEGRHIRHQSQEGSAKRKLRRSHSRSSEISPQHSWDHDSDHSERVRNLKENESVDKIVPLKTKSESTGSVLNGDEMELGNQQSTDGKYDRKDTEVHSRLNEESGSKERSKVKHESLSTRSPNARCNYNDHYGEQVQNKKCKLNSPQFGRDAFMSDRESRSCHRYRRQRSRSRSGSHNRYNRRYGSHHQRLRSRSRDNGRGRRWQRSKSRSEDNESKFGGAEKRLRSRTRSRERRTRDDGKANDSEDVQKRLYEGDEQRKYSLSKSESRHGSRKYDVRYMECRQSKELVKDFSDTEVHSNDGEYLKKLCSESTERNWSGYSNRTFNHKFNGTRGDRRNSGSRRGGYEDDRTSHENYRGDFRQRRWRGDVQDSLEGGRDGKLWGQRRRHHDSREQHEGQEKEVQCDDGQQLEDMVVKSLAKLRQDSDREQQTVSDGSNIVASDQKRNCMPIQDRTEDDHSTIPVLLSKKSMYAKNDLATHDQALEPESNSYKSCRIESFANESATKNQLHLSGDQPSRHPAAGHSRFQGVLRHSALSQRFEFQRQGRPQMPLQARVTPAHPIGVRLPPGLVQPGVIVAPFNLRPPAIQEVSGPVDWHVAGPVGANPAPPIGQGRPLVQVGGLIRTQVPVEFLRGPPLPPAPARFPHPPPFQPGLPPPPPLSLPRAHHPGVPMQPLPVRTGNPLHLQQTVALIHTHHIRSGLVDVRNFRPSFAIVPSHPPPTTINIGIPPPPLPVRITAPDNALPGYGFTMSSQGIESSASNASPTPPPPPPPVTVSVGVLDPRLNPVKLFSQQQSNFALQRFPSSTSDESVKSDLSEECNGERPAVLQTSKNILQSRSPAQHCRTSERPHSTSSLGSGYSPEHVAGDAYAETLFEEPCRHPSEAAEVQIKSNIPENLSKVSGASHVTVSRGLQASDAVSKLVNNEEESALIPEIINPMESPIENQKLMRRFPASDSSNVLNVSTHALDLIQVVDLQKVLETVRTSVLPTEEESKCQDKLPNRMDQIAEEVKLALKPHFGKGLINKEEYKDIMRKTVPKIFSSKSCLDRVRIQTFVQEYVSKIVKSRKPDKGKKSSSECHKPQRHNAKISSKTA